MSKTSRSAVLRRVASDIIGQVVERGDIPESERQDWITSLVRQWISYDGQAAFFFGGHQWHFALAYTPLGKPYCDPELTLPEWIPELIEKWKIDPDDLPEVLEQLNGCQSAEVTNSEGMPLRLSVDPKEKRRSVEKQIETPNPPEAGWNFHHAAVNALRDHFKFALDEKELHALAGSLTRQWQKFGDVASLYIPGYQLFFIKEMENDVCCVTTKRREKDVEAQLRTLGFRPEAIPEVIAKINLDQEIPFTDNEGRPALLWQHAKIGDIMVTRFRQDRGAKATESMPFCRACGAVLPLGPNGALQKFCPSCRTDNGRL